MRHVRSGLPHPCHFRNGAGQNKQQPLHFVYALRQYLPLSRAPRKRSHDSCRHRKTGSALFRPQGKQLLSCRPFPPTTRRGISLNPAEKKRQGPDFQIFFVRLPEPGEARFVCNAESTVICPFASTRRTDRMTVPVAHRVYRNNSSTDIITGTGQAKRGKHNAVSRNTGFQPTESFTNKMPETAFSYRITLPHTCRKGRRKHGRSSPLSMVLYVSAMLKALPSAEQRPRRYPPDCFRRPEPYPDDLRRNHPRERL